MSVFVFSHSSVSYLATSGVGNDSRACRFKSCNISTNPENGNWEGQFRHVRSWDCRGHGGRSEALLNQVKKKITVVSPNGKSIRKQNPGGHSGWAPTPGMPRHLQQTVLCAATVAHFKRAFTSSSADITQETSGARRVHGRSELGPVSAGRSCYYRTMIRL